MEKINKTILEACNEATCLGNELVVLPQSGEVGFEEYFAHKTRAVRDAKKIFSTFGGYELMLEYPAQDTKEPMAFERFFESPFVVARNHVFKGCFGIDITNYINQYHAERFLDLIAYMRSNPDAVYVLFMYSGNSNEIRAMHDFLVQYMDIRLVNIPLPSVQELIEYTISHIRDFSLHVDAAVESDLHDYYTKHPAGFEVADYIVRQLQKEQYCGDRKTMQTVLETVPRGLIGTARSGNIGY